MCSKELTAYPLKKSETQDREEKQTEDMVYEFVYTLLQCIVPCPLGQTRAGLRGLNILTDIDRSYFPHRQEEMLCLHAEDV